MAMTAYSRVKLFWGAVDAERADEAAYTPAQVKPMGVSAVPPGIGVRRCSFRWTRLGLAPPEDVLTTYLDFQNFTSGEPDDSWTTGDFTTLEAAISTFWNSLKPETWNKHVLAELRWYRIGPGVLPPNPPVRITPIGTPGTAANAMPPQVCISLTKRTASRRQWGRMYLPCNNISSITSGARIGSTVTTLIANAADALMTTASAADFVPVVYSPTRQKAYSIEKWQVDDLYDVVRSRRFDAPITRTVKP